MAFDQLTAADAGAAARDKINGNFQQADDRASTIENSVATVKESTALLPSRVDTLGARLATLNTTVAPLPSGLAQALVRLAALEGQRLQVRVSGGRLEYQPPGLSTWAPLLRIADLQGAPGQDGEDFYDLTPRNRPGDSPRMFSSVLTGGPVSSLPVLPDNSVAISDAGSVVRLLSAGVVRARRYTPIEGGRVYVVRYSVRRQADALDPSNDTVRCGIAWYGESGGLLGVSVVVDFTDLRVSNGRQKVVKVAATAAADQVDVIAPPSARYASPYVEVFGGPQVTDVELVDLIDLTDGALLSADLSAFEGRVSTLEGENAGQRLNSLETAVGSPNIATFTSRVAAQGATIGASVEMIRTLGGATSGDEQDYLYARSASPPAEGFQTADGSYWDRVATDSPWFTGRGRVERLRVGFASDPVYDGTTIDVPNTLAVGVDWSVDGPVIVPDGKQLDHNELRQLFKLLGSARASWFNFVMTADEASDAASNLYPGIGILINNGPGTVKGFYSRVEIGRPNTGGIAISRVGGVADRAGSNFTAGDQCSIDNEDPNKPVNVGYWLQCNKYFHDKAQLDHGLLGSLDIEVQQAFVQCFAGGPGNFASLISADGGTVLYAVDRFGNVNALNVQARSGLKVGGLNGEGVVQLLRGGDAAVVGDWHFDPITLATVFNNNLGLGYHSFVVNGVERWRLDKDSLSPGEDAAYSFGSATRRPSVVYSATPTISTSDQRYKVDLGDIPEAVLRAWGRVRARFFQFKDAVAQKGEAAARQHIGLYAQEVEAAFAAEGLDPWRFALLCRDELSKKVERTRTITRPKMEMVTVDHVEMVVEGGVAVRRIVPAQEERPVVNYHPVQDEAGNPVMESYVDGYEDRQQADAQGVVTTIREPIIRRRPMLHPEPVMEDVAESYWEDVPSGEDRLGLRYEACLVLEAAWLRNELATLTARVAAIESRA